jgi:Domain of unknown function (DUF4249)
MKKVISHISYLISFFVLASCEDPISIESQTRLGESQLTVDAWLTNESKEQSVRLTLSSPYFSTDRTKPALGAKVYVAEIFADNSLGKAITLSDKKNDGNYVWTPKSKTDALCEVGKKYGLLVEYENEKYVSASSTNRVPKIDSLTYYADELPIAADDLPKSGFVSEFYAKDPKGESDCYWIRTYKNGKRFSKPSDLSIAYDAGFSPGSKSDGLMFIRPIRQSINNRDTGFWQEKDTIQVELFSIPEDAYYFLLQVRQESANGGIFSTPPANIPSNIFNQNTKGKKALGFFATSATSTFSTVINKNKAKTKPQN